MYIAQLLGLCSVHCLLPSVWGGVVQVARHIFGHVTEYVHAKLLLNHTRTTHSQHHTALLITLIIAGTNMHTAHTHTHANWKFIRKRATYDKHSAMRLLCDAKPRRDHYYTLGILVQMCWLITAVNCADWMAR